LEVLNGEESDLMKCYSNLEVFKIRYSDKEEWINWLDWMTGNTTELTWPAFNSKDEKIIRRKKPARIDIAKMRTGNYPLIIFADGKEEPMPAEHIYIEISLNGELRKNGNSIPVEEIVFHGFLKRHQGFYIQEGATITTIIEGVPHKITEPSEEIPEFRLWIEPGELDDEKYK